MNEINVDVSFIEHNKLKRDVQELRATIYELEEQLREVQKLGARISKLEDVLVPHKGVKGVKKNGTSKAGNKVNPHPKVQSKKRKSTASQAPAECSDEFSSDSEESDEKECLHQTARRTRLSCRPRARGGRR